MAINPLQLPPILSGPAIDFSPLARLGDVYRDAQARGVMEQLGQQIQQTGTIDYNKAAGQIFQYKPDMALSLLKLGQEAQGAQEAANLFGPGGVYGGGTPNVTTSPNPSAASVARATPVGGQAPRSWYSENEAIEKGLYDPKPGTVVAQAPAAVQRPPSSSSLDARTAVVTDPEIVALKNRIEGASRVMASNTRLPQSSRDALKVSIEGWNKELEKRIEASEKSASDVRAPLYKGLVDQFEKSTSGAQSAAEQLDALKDLRTQIDNGPGIFSGTGAEKKLWLAKAAKLVGIDVDPTRIENTEAFQATVGKQVAALVKSFGSGTSITNQDREFAAKMAAGDITLDEASIRRIFTILEKGNYDTIDRHNKKIERFSRSDPRISTIADQYRVEKPAGYVAPSRPPAPAPTEANPPTIAGARRAPDGKEYIQRNGQWFRVDY